MTPPPVVTIRADHLWMLMVIAGVYAHDDDQDLVDLTRRILTNQAGAWLVSFEAYMDQEAAGVSTSEEEDPH